MTIDGGQLDDGVLDDHHVASTFSCATTARVERDQLAVARSSFARADAGAELALHRRFANTARPRLRRNEQRAFAGI
jgi:hypothetical protein